MANNLQLIRTSEDINNNEIIPFLIYINEKLYRLKNWNECIKIFYYFANIRNNNYFQDHMGKEYKGETYLSNYELNSSYIKVTAKYFVKKYDDYKCNLTILKNFLNNIFFNNEVVVYFKYSLETDDNKLYEKLAINKKKTKSGKYLFAKINREIFTEEEKFIRKIEKQFDLKSMLGDIVISSDDYNILNTYMKRELSNLISKNTYKIFHEKVFVVGLIQYAIKYYNKKSFWPSFENEYGITVKGNQQSLINNAFEAILKRYDKIFDDKVAIKIDNICLHCFVTNYYANKLFNYLFDFWKLDLKRNIENLNLPVMLGKKTTHFDVLVDELEKADNKHVNDIMHHTSLAIKYFKKICKNKIKKMLYLIDECFWESKLINVSTNRLYNLFREWIIDSKSKFQKELTDVQVKKGGRGQQMLSSPTIKYNYEKDSFKLIIPKQYFEKLDENEFPKWYISSKYNDLNMIIEPGIFDSNAGLFSDECFIELPKKNIFDSIQLYLRSDSNLYAKFVIKESKIRFFNDRLDLIILRPGDYTIPIGDVIAVSHHDFPVELLYSERFEKYHNNEYDVNIFDLTEGDILLLGNEEALKAGKKIEEGFVGGNELSFVKLINQNNELAIFNKLPKLILKIEKELVRGTGLIINNERFRLDELNCQRFTLNDGRTTNCIIINLDEYIIKNGIYNIIVSVPKTLGNKEFNFAYLKEFSFEFINSPYIFKEYGEVSFDIDSNIVYSLQDVNWTKENNRLVYTFNFNVKEREKIDELELQYKLQNGYCKLKFYIPVLLWKYDGVENLNWKVKKPNDLILKKIPNNIFFKANFDLTNSKNKVFIDEYNDSDDDLELPFKKEKGTDIYKCNIQLFNNKINREEVYRVVKLKLNDEIYDLCKIVCKSVVMDQQITGDFYNDCLHGYFDIKGDGEYFVQVFYKDILIADDVVLDCGTFSIDYSLKTGIYKVILYEVEDDDFIFENSSFIIGTYELQLVNVLNLENSIINIERIEDIDDNVAAFALSSRHIIKQLHKCSYDDIIGNDYLINMWREDLDLESLLYYKGSLFYENSLNQHVYIHGVLVAFKNNYQINDVVILKQDKKEKEYIELEYDFSRMFLVHSSEKFHNSEKYKRFLTLDDDLYRITISIQNIDEEDEENAA